MKRRELLRAVVAAGLAGGAAAAEEASGQAPKETLTTADLAAAERIAGRPATEAQREQMLGRVKQTRERLQALRAAPLDGVEPALRFDPRLPGTVVPRGRSRCLFPRGRAPRTSGDPESAAFLTVAELARLLRARKITSTALTRMYLERLKRHDPTLRCVVTLTEERALEQAARADAEIAAGRYRGPLHGIPWGAKDLLATKGVPTTWGARPYRQQTFDHDATVVERLEAAGGVLVAKLSLGELAMGDRWFGGRTRNPWAPEDGSSGSSAGSASAVAAGLVGFAIGSETHGSIVSPCAVCGTTGLRPTFGRVSRYGAMALAWSLDKLGPICRGVEDCALVFSAIHGPDGHDPSVADVPFQWDPRAPLERVRVGIDTAAFEKAAENKERRPILDAVLATLRGLGIDPRPVTLPPWREEYHTLLMGLAVEAAASFQALTLSGGTDLLEGQEEHDWPNTFRVASTLPAVEYLQSLRVRRQLQERMAEALQEIDVYVTVPFESRSLLYTNMTGHPSVVTRCGMWKGKPQAIEFIGNLYREPEALRVALAFEQAAGWNREWPGG